MIEIRKSQYNHPEQNSGQHTNGPPMRYVRRNQGPWYRVDKDISPQALVMAVEMLPWDRFTKDFCVLVPPLDQDEQGE